MRGLSSTLSLFRNKFNTVNNTGARVLDYIYHKASTLLKIAFVHEKVKMLSSFTHRYNGRHYVKLLNL